MSKSIIEDKFNLSCSLVKMLPQRPDNDDLLYLYGMYKQAKEGRCTIPEPSTLNVVEHAKWNAWNENRDIDKSVAMTFYISKVNQIFTQSGL